jgi:hypothetical protein
MSKQSSGPGLVQRISVATAAATIRELKTWCGCLGCRDFASIQSARSSWRLAGSRRMSCSQAAAS